LTLSQFLQILRARRILIACFAIGLALAGALVSILMPSVYVAQVSLVADVKATDPVTGNAVLAQTLTNYLNTQSDVITSRAVALKVVEKMRLADDRSLQAAFQERARGAGSLREWIADRLSSNLEVELARSSNVFRINYEASDAGKAALFANAFADAYIQTTIELKMDPARRQSGWFDEQIVGLRQRLEAAQAKLSDFQRENTLVTTDGRLDLESARLAGMSTELVAAQAEASDARARRDQMKLALEAGRTEELPDVVRNGLVQSMKAELTRAEGKLAEAAERYGSNHPQYVAASAEVSSLRRRMFAELQTARGSIEQTAQIANQRAAQMQAALEEQKRRILELKRASDERDVLGRDVESAQRTYDAATQRASAVRLESQLDQGTVAVLAPAMQPLDPARPRPLLNTVAALLFGLVLGVGLAVAAEWRDRRVRAAADIPAATGILLLAEFPPPPRGRPIGFLPRLQPI
jgi:polysaccharide biosynthesis transport protein